MNIQVETITLKDGSKMDVIRDIEKVRKVCVIASELAQRLRLWSTPDGQPLCDGDKEALGKYEACESQPLTCPKCGEHPDKHVGQWQDCPEKKLL